MNEKDLLEVRELLNNPNGDDMTPYPIIDDNGTVNVIGDANKTEIKAGTYNMTFRVPFVNEENGATDYKTVKKTFENVFITPRLDPIMAQSIATLKALLFKEENGKVVGMTEEESVTAFYDRYDDFMDALYTLVASFLRVDVDLKPFMSADDVMDISKELLATYPEMVKGGNAFFTGLPSK